MHLFKLPASISMNSRKHLQGEILTERVLYEQPCRMNGKECVECQSSRLKGRLLITSNMSKNYVCTKFLWKIPTTGIIFCRLKCPVMSLEQRQLLLTKFGLHQRPDVQCSKALRMKDSEVSQWNSSLAGSLILKVTYPNTINIPQ